MERLAIILVAFAITATAAGAAPQKKEKLPNECAYCIDREPDGTCTRVWPHGCQEWRLRVKKQRGSRANP
jgi:hypothetical protein